MSEKMGFNMNMDYENMGGFAYDPSKQHGKRTDLFVDLEKANKNKQTVLRNILSGTVAFKGIDALIESSGNNTLNESELKNSLDTFVKGVKVARFEYIHPLINGVGGRIRHLLSYDAAGADVFTEADKIAKDLSYYEQVSPNDVLLKSGENRDSLHKIKNDFQSLINLYTETHAAVEKSSGLEISFRGKSGELSDENFKNQILATCREANDLLMDIEASTVSKNFSEINILVNDLRQTTDKAELVNKLVQLKSLVEQELKN